MPQAIPQAAAAFANWAYATFFAAAGYGTTAHAVISATLFYSAQAVLYAGVQMGLSAVAQAQAPNPESQKLTKKQSRPPRQYCGGGPVRMSGPYMLREAVGSKLALVIALCDQRLGSVSAFYLNDDKVTVSGGWVQEGDGGRYGTGDLVRIDYRLGLPTETRYAIFPSEFDTVWPADARGDGVSSLGIFAQHRSRESFSTHFPNGEIIPSAVITPVCFDWRDPSQDRLDESTWKGTPNPVVWLVHLEWWYFGRSWARTIAPVLSDLTDEADYCDALVPKIGGTEPRYRWSGGWNSATEPDAIRTNLLASMDGWMTTDGQGRLILKAGRYDEPEFIITADHIEAFSWRRGQTDEEACNELIVSYVSPEHDFTEVECDAWRDEADISTRGKVRSESLGLTWVSHHSQARRLAKRKMSKVNAPRRGTVRTGIYGLNGLGERYIRVQNPVLASMTDVVCEVMNVEIDFNAATVTFDIIQADPDIDAWDPATEEGRTPPVGEAAPVEPYVEAPTEFGAAADGPKVNLSWRNPFSGIYDFVNIYRGTTASFADATVVNFYGGAPGELVRTADSPPTGTYRYWIQAVDSFGLVSTPVGPAGPVTTTTAPPVTTPAPTNFSVSKSSSTVTLTARAPTTGGFNTLKFKRSGGPYSAAVDVQTFTPALGQTVTHADTPGANSWNYWAVCLADDGTPSTPVGPLSITVP